MLASSRPAAKICWGRRLLAYSLPHPPLSRLRLSLLPRHPRPAPNKVVMHGRPQALNALRVAQRRVLKV
jgi:hypothetical protein